MLSWIKYMYVYICICVHHLWRFLFIHTSYVIPEEKFRTSTAISDLSSRSSTNLLTFKKKRKKKPVLWLRITQNRRRSNIDIIDAKLLIRSKQLHGLSRAHKISRNVWNIFGKVSIVAENSFHFLFSTRWWVVGTVLRNN